jgi:uncharacterized membrane protein YsdA (DUF1294 family)
MELLAEVPPSWIALYAIAVNLVAFAAFGLDKKQAQLGVRRTSEAALLGWALVGGTAGAFAGRAAFRHKTRKQPFSNQLHGILILQLAAVAFAVTWFATG